jgi:hypothetical protein
MATTPVVPTDAEEVLSPLKRLTIAWRLWCQGVTDGIVLYGIGTPEGKVTASPGRLYGNLSGGAGLTLYVKESGTNTNTGWVAK